MQGFFIRLHFFAVPDNIDTSTCNSKREELAELAWSAKKKSGLEWPKNENGDAVPPTFLAHVHGGPLDMELTFNLLEAYGIPHICEYPHNGLFGKLILGFPPGGIKVFVPETMLEDAQNVMNADIYEDEDDNDEY